ncbi:MAG: NAD(P)-dependent oxidoreductase [Candidatus Ratteibacteria bacterium]|nr:NAD(P)-dependent oxidoreductase [Candidatus Ratteibacteria bacterium]
MKKVKICLLLTYEGVGGKIFDKDVIEELKKIGDVFIWDGKTPVPVFCKDADIIVTSWGSPKLDVSILKVAPSLKFIFHAAGTIKTVVDPELMKKGVRVSSASNILGRNVAITTFGLVLIGVKKIPWWNEYIKSTGNWRENNFLLTYTNEIGTSTVGVISMSNVGKNLVLLLKNVTDNILVYDPFWTSGDIEKFGGIKVEILYEIAERCDVIALCTPFLKTTEGMIDRKFFQNMKNGAVFINTARGKIIDEAALIEELKKERIFACLDVTDPEEPPPPDSPLRKLKNVLLSPHIAGIVNSGMKDIGVFCVDEIKRFIKKEVLVNEILLEKLDITA